MTGQSHHTVNFFLTYCKNNVECQASLCALSFLLESKQPDLLLSPVQEGARGITEHF